MSQHLQHQQRGHLHALPHKGAHSSQGLNDEQGRLGGQGVYQIALAEKSTALHRTKHIMTEGASRTRPSPASSYSTNSQRSIGASGTTTKNKPTTKRASWPRSSPGSLWPRKAWHVTGQNIMTKRTSWPLPSPGSPWPAKACHLQDKTS